MAEGDRLGALHMGEAGHDGRDMVLRLRQQRAAASAFKPSSARPQASRTHSRKSVTTWSLRERAVCSRPAAGPDDLGQPRLDVQVDVFQLPLEDEFALARSRVRSARAP